MASGAWFAAVFGLTIAGALASTALIVALRPWLVRTALARPSARGLHTLPTPQGGGIAVLAATVLATSGGAWLFGFDADETLRLIGVLLAALGLGALGFVDDIRPLPALPRLIVQLSAMAVGVMLLPPDVRVLPVLPVGIERAVLIVGGTWFVNLTNFMDGMDWMTVANMIPVSAGLVVFWAAGDVPPVPGVVALGLLAGLLGYAPFNKPVATLFLGDVGSLPIGFLIAFCLLGLAGQGDGPASGALVAAVLLSLYPIADSGLTLAWRLRRGEKIWEPHRDHFYQVAVARGFTVWQVLGRVIATNLVLAVLAWESLGRSMITQAIALALGILVTGATLMALSRAETKRASA